MSRLGMRLDDKLPAAPRCRRADGPLGDAIVSRDATGYHARMPGPRPRGERALSVAERSAAYRARRKVEAEAAGKAPVVRIRYRKPQDKRSRPQRWRDAVETLADLLDDYQSWRDNLPSSLEDSTIADRLDELLHLRDAVDQLDAAELPKGFGRD